MTNSIDLNTLIALPQVFSGTITIKDNKGLTTEYEFKRNNLEGITFSDKRAAEYWGKIYEPIQ